MARKLIINESDDVQAAVKNITQHTNLSKNEAQRIVQRARLYAARQFNISQDQLDPNEDPEGVAGFSAAWQRRASQAAMASKGSSKEKEGMLMASDDNMPSDKKSKIDILLKKTEEDLASLKKEFTDLMSGEQGQVTETIKKSGDKYELVSKSGKNLGKYPTKAGAEKREKQVNYFKQKNESKGSTKVEKLVIEMHKHANAGNYKAVGKCVVGLQKYVNDAYPRVSQYVVENVRVAINEAKRNMYGLPRSGRYLPEDASCGATSSAAVATGPAGNLFGGKPQKRVKENTKSKVKTPVAESQFPEDSDSIEHFTSHRKWLRAVERCGFTMKQKGPEYTAVDSTGNTVGECDGQNGWVDTSACSNEVDEEIINELSPATHQRYIAAANRSRQAATDDMMSKDGFDPKLVDKMGNRAERTIKSINKLHGGSNFRRGEI